MNLRKLLAAALMTMSFTVAAFAQGYRDLDTASNSIARGFSARDAQRIAAGLGEGDQVMLRFPGLIEQSGFFGRDQATLLLENLFGKVETVSFENVSTKTVRAQNQYHITAKWTVRSGGRTEERDVYVTLAQKGEVWTIVSIQSSGR